MGLFQKKEPGGGGLAVQLREGGRHPFGALDGYVPLRHGEIAIYRAIREAVPIVDAAIWKLIRLTGGVTVTCRDKKAQDGLDWFLQHVNTGRGQRGLQSFLDCYLDSMLTCGRAVGEIVPDRRRTDIAALLCGNVADIEIKEGDSPLEFAIWGRDPGGMMRRLPRQELLLFTPFQPETDSPYGVSLLRSMPFLTEILLKIYQATGMNWERMGNLRFAVVYRPGDTPMDQALVQERSRQIAREWSAAMQAGKDGSVRDFVAVGDVDIKVIGADNQVLDSEVPVRQILEQLVARTGIPPFLLGLTWSSTERMSTQQADMMTSEITAIRRALEPVVERICELWLRLHGYDSRVEVDWQDINLQDLVEEARAQLYWEQARSLEMDNDAREKGESV
ncbi:serine/threonine protein phosphatase [Pseudoflavonifractor phocaeensis]|uniref:serine/threonine protein phosphatase n=1 Tax=Pseudoflavonifractor phocaeensis TaxID=1870988 RepID=UPI00195CB17D|nr:serine/threonine protein phosphatase [Pseudoflavonifractor phocaeensis]MBM6885335.1 serine/threonine protein phosphatase [Pseudoflavonifractor phocaeensis]